MRIQNHEILKYLSIKFTRTIENADADLYPNRFFGKPTRRYLVVERQKNAPEIISDVVLIGEDDPRPHGFSLGSLKNIC